MGCLKLSVLEKNKSPLWVASSVFDENENECGSLYDYGARWYDAGVGRWTSVDVLTDHPNQLNKSPYAYAWNNPVNLTDPDGNCPICPYLLGALSGAGLEYGIQVATNLYSGKGVKSFTDVDGTAIGIAAAGGATGVGLVKNAGKLLQLIKIGTKADDALNVADKLVTKADDLVNASAKVDNFADPKFAKQLTKNLGEHGEKSIKNSAKNLQKNLSEHQSKLEALKESGGTTSSVEREIKTFSKQLETVKEFAKQNKIELK